jgi:hypothetical protein
MFLQEHALGNKTHAAPECISLCSWWLHMHYEWQDTVPVGPILIIWLLTQYLSVINVHHFVYQCHLWWFSGDINTSEWLHCIHFRWHWYMPNLSFCMHAQWHSEHHCALKKPPCACRQKNISTVTGEGIRRWKIVLYMASVIGLALHSCAPLLHGLKYPSLLLVPRNHLNDCTPTWK